MSQPRIADGISGRAVVSVAGWTENDFCFGHAFPQHSPKILVFGFVEDLCHGYLSRPLFHFPLPKGENKGVSCDCGAQKKEQNWRGKNA